MCGVVGMIDSRLPGPERLEDLVTQMSDSLCHRGPDGSGVWLDASVGVGLGHRRLSIIDLSDAGRQPMTSESGRYTMVFNGEVFNFVDMRRTLEATGARFRGHSDTEVLLAAIEHWGLTQAIDRAIGMFAIALWDSADRSLTLVRDRLGIKPLFYSHGGGLFLFGSELKALRRHPDHRDDVDVDALSLYLRYRCVPSPYSIYAGTRKLPPGHLLVVRPGDVDARVESTPFWAPRRFARSDTTGPPLTETIDELEALLLDAVRLRLIADVPLGAFLSGGVDSSLVVALMQSQTTTRVKTFTVGFREEAFDEAQQAKRVATQLGTDHHELYVTPHEAMSVVPRLASIYDEPFADPSALPTVLIAEFARRSVTACLSGDGGDEQFGGYERYGIADRIWKARRLAPDPFARAMGRVLHAAADAPTLRRRLPTDLVTRLSTLASVLPIGDRGALYHRMRSTWDPADALLIGAGDDSAYWGERWHDGGDYWDAMMEHDLVSYLPDDILTKLDRATMAVGLEGRVPLLDHRVVEFTAGLPRSAVRQGSQSKVALRAVLARYLTGDAVPQGKHGFNAPVDQWIVGPMREWAEDLLNEAALADSGYLNVAAVRQKWAEHLAGTHNWRAQLWSILMLQDWRREQLRPAATVGCPSA